MMRKILIFFLNFLLVISQISFANDKTSVSNSGTVNEKITSIQPKVSLDKLLGKVKPSAVEKTQVKSDSTDLKQKSASKVSSSELTTSSSSGDSSEQMQSHKINVDLFSGSGSFSIPIVTPTARGGINPGLQINYSTQNGNDIFGVGWNLNLGKVEQIKGGANKPDFRYLDWQGGRYKIVLKNHGDNYEPSYWQVEDGKELFFSIRGGDTYAWDFANKVGTHYYFGKIFDNKYVDPENSLGKGSEKNCQRFHGMQDINGNTLVVDYDSSGGIDIYYGNKPSFNPQLSILNPTDFIYHVKFIMADTQRDDVIQNYVSKYFGSFPKCLVQEIQIFADNNLISKYAFEYFLSITTNRNLLRKICEYDGAGYLIKPPVEFEYTNSAGVSFHRGALIANPTSGDNLWSANYNDWLCSSYIAHYDYGPLSPRSTINGLSAFSWNHFDVVTSSGSFQQYAGYGQGTWNINNRGNLSFNGPKASAVKFQTYLFSTTPKTIYLSPGIGYNGGIWVNGEYATNSINQINLKEGYNLIEYTDYSGLRPYSFSLNKNIADEVSLMASSQVVFGSYSADFNGDGFMDLGSFFKSSGEFTVALSNGADSTFLPKETWISGFGVARAVFLGDFNLDGKIDLYSYTDRKIALSNGTSFNVISDASNKSSLKLLQASSSPTYFPEVKGVGNVDGDNVSDFFRVYGSMSSHGLCASPASIDATGNPIIDLYHQKMYTFNGIDFGIYPDRVLYNDINGDGLMDVIYFKKDPSSVELIYNEGVDLALASTDKVFYKRATFSDFPSDKELLLMDLNNDGQADIAYYDYSRGKLVYWPVNDDKFGERQEFPYEFYLKNESTRFQVVDINKDGLADVISFNDLGQLETVLSDGTFPDLLEEIKFLGASTKITYKSSLTSNNNRIPFNLPLIEAITTTELVTNTQMKTTYIYKNGFWDSQHDRPIVDPEFRGFGEVTVIDSDGNYSVSEFLQDDVFKGRLKQVSIYDKQGNLYSKVVNGWKSEIIENQGANTNFIYLSRSDNFVYDGNSTGKRTAKEFFYDESPQLGNLTKTIDLGEVDLETGEDVGEDSLVQEISYLNYGSLSGFPKEIILKDYFNSVLNKTWNYYDGNNSIYGILTKGLLTKKEFWAGTDNSDDNPVVVYNYDIFGNLVSSVDSYGNNSTTVYDPQFNFFPIKQINALGHVVETGYYGINGESLDDGNGLKGVWGQTKYIRDPNNLKSYRVYDSAGRLVKLVSPLDSIAFPTQEIETKYFNTYSTVSIKNRVNYLKPETVDTIKFFDGLGRLIQEKQLAPDGTYVVTGQKAYDGRGMVIKSYLPQFVNTPINFLDPINVLRPFALNKYDAMGRLVQITSPDGTFRNNYFDDWIVCSVDANGHKQCSEMDSRQNIIRKHEYFGADGRHSAYPYVPYSLYATIEYLYDSLGNLLSTQDANGNVISITYDALGRKVFMDDPDMGSWFYEYDKNGNLLKQTDARGQVVEMSYDKINRLIHKTNYADLDTFYTYDDPLILYSKGRLTRVDYKNGKIIFEYDELGRETQSEKTIDGQDYHVERTYDALNNLQSLIYPDGKEVYYKYGPTGEVKQIIGEPGFD